jgi:hypothetical protein
MKERAEQYDEQVDRVRLMAEGNPTWDLSPNDLAALAAVLQRYDAYAAVIDAIEAEGEYGDYGAAVVAALAHLNDVVTKQKIRSRHVS